LRRNNNVKLGHWVAGFVQSSRGLYGRLVYAGRISEKLPVGDYEEKYSGRRDAIYRKGDGGELYSLKPQYHPDKNQQDSDKSGYVFVFDTSSTWYFGASAPTLPPHLLDLAPSARDYNVHGATPHQIEAFGDWLRKSWEPGIHGAPRDAEGASCTSHQKLRTGVC
jgi:hypothetical protein